MACPPNLWNGLYILYKSILRDIETLTLTQGPEGTDLGHVGLSGDRNKKAEAEAQALSRISSLFGPRIKFLVTGGGPTAAEVSLEPASSLP